MLRSFDASDSRFEIIMSDDPVRPHIPFSSRVANNRKVYVLEENNEIKAVVCMALTTHVPTVEEELDHYTTNIHLNEFAVLYTLWSYVKGAGRQIALDIVEHIKSTYPGVKRIVTLSPPTVMASRFHTRNGADTLQVNETTVNFEYKFSRFNELA